MRRRSVLISGAALLAAACAGQGQGARWGDGLAALYAHPGRSEWPALFHEQPAEVQVMYRYAVANKEILRWIPCFCGCVNGGHGSNFDCYVRAELPDGRVQLDTMSFG